MKGFIDFLAGQLAREPENLARKTVIFPNKRAGIFLKHALIKNISKTFVFPGILSITEFLSRVTGWQKAEYYDLLFTLLEAYRQVSREIGLDSQEAEKFLGWGAILLNDFDEIDKFNVQPEQIFTALHDIKALEEWAENLENEPGNIPSNYLKFYQSLPRVYQVFKKKLKQNGLAYEGMIYRQALETYADWSKNYQPGSLIFAGFNAFSKTERLIIRQLLKDQKAGIFWDIDQFYLEEPFGAGKFFRQYRRDQVFAPGIKALFNQVKPPKEVTFVKTSNDTEQLHYINHLIEKWQREHAQDENFWLNTAIVINDPAVSVPLIHTLPAKLKSLNITFGIPLYHFDETKHLLALLHLKTSLQRTRHIDWEDLKSLLKDGFFKELVPPGQFQTLKENIEKTHRKRFYEKTFDQFLRQAGINDFNSLLSNQKIPEFLSRLSQLLNQIIQKTGDKTRQLVLIELQTLINRSLDLQSQYDIFQNFDTLEGFLRKLTKEVKIFFEGEPLKGLQVMGLLETRALAFERIVMLGMNEGVIPKGKKQESFIPFDIRKRTGLPVYEERNAISAYHVYRLFAHSKNSYWLYNGNPSGLFSGEPSRYLLQLKHKLPPKRIIPKEITIESETQTIPKPAAIPKDQTTLELLRINLTERGLSASALKNYLHRPYDFYTDFVLGLNPQGELETSIGARWSGLIIHDVMEALYKPFVNKPLKEKDLLNAIQKIPAKVREIFFEKYLPQEQKNLTAPDITGKDLLALEAAQNMIKKYIRHDLNLIKKGHELIIRDLEKKYQTDFITPSGHKVRLKGYIDRIDTLDGHIRIIDYKTGKVEGLSHRNPLEEALRQEDKSYLLQLYFYALLLKNTRNTEENITLYIYSPRTRSVETSKEITQERVILFENFLSEIINEMLNPAIPFGEPFPDLEI